MSKQWGHGYHKGYEDAQSEYGTIVGLWFHSKKDGKIHWQGRIVNQVNDDAYLVQLYEWGFGTASERRMVLLREMKDWDFYKTDLDMRYAECRKSGCSDEDFEWSEKCLDLYRKAYA